MLQPFKNSLIVKLTPVFCVICAFSIGFSQEHRGVSWVGGPKISKEALSPIKEIHSTWMVQTPFGWQRGIHSTEVKLSADGYYWGESAEGIRTTHEYAKGLGIKTLLKPHVWLLGAYKGAWRGDISMQSEEDWRRWFRSYEKWILYYAGLAEEHNIEALCIGTEFHIASTKREKDWRQVIEKVRSIYSGQLTYAANWDREYEEIKFWDALDFIGIQAYFPLTEEENAETNDLKAAWPDHIKRIESVSNKFNKKVVFTEFGYKSTVDAAIKPWEWPESKDEQHPISLEMQARCYDAFFETVWNKPWFDGCYIWKWFPDHEKSGGISHKGFTPQNKPAEKIIAKWYAK